MFYVYLLESLATPGQRYVGFTTNLKQRFDDHNGGKSSHTAKFKTLVLGDIHRLLG
jgi:predicted GIY-YIG superfamily endonuclease